MYMTILGTNYELATTLRVAYEVQGQNNHKPYAEVFKSIGEMGIEKQLDIIYAAFKCANPVEAKTKITQNDFREYCFDNYTLKEVLQILEGIIKGIMGDDFDEDVEATGQSSGDEGN